MKKFFAILLSVLLVSAFAVSAVAVNWEDGQTRAELDDGVLGNYTFDNAYEFVFRVDDVNGSIGGEDNTIITNADAYAASNPNWAISVLLAPTSDANVYEVALAPVVTPGSAAAGVEKGINFENGNIVLICHSSGSLPEATNDKGELKTFPNWEQKVASMALKVGDKITLAGVDLAAGTVDNGTATVQEAPEGYKVTNGVPEEPEEPTEPEEPATPAEPKMFWVTHLNDSGVEGAGVIFTEAYSGCAWWKHYAFAPVADAEGVFEITAIVDGPALNGTGVEPLAIPEGGFVYAINVGNNWKDLCEENGVTGDGSTGLWYDDEFHASEPNYATANVSAMWEDINAWTVGMQVTFEGIDLANLEVPTSTPDVNWYDEAYVCTSTYTVYTGETETPETPETPDKPEVPEVNLEDELKEALGEANADAKFDLVIDAPETYKAGDEITVTVTVKNITAEPGLHILNFTLNYDNEKLLLTNDLDEEENNSLVCVDVDALPKGWENFSKVANDADQGNEVVLPLNDGIILASVLTDKDTASAALTADGAVVFTFTFTAKEDAAGDIGIVIPNATVEGAINDAAGATTFAGNGAYAIIAEEEDEPEVPSEDPSEEPSEDPSEPETPVKPGDASAMIVFAIIALVAVVGSAVVIKSRK